MKSLLPTLICCFFILAPSLYAQEDYIIDGKTYPLKTAVKGDIDLLWNIIDRRYHYFLKKGETITELRNTKQNGKFQKEYKAVLKENTSDKNISIQNVKLTLGSLRSFFIKYNTMKNPDFSNEAVDTRLKLLLGAYGGVTNSAFTSNIANTTQGIGGLELELVDPVKLKRHSLVLDVRHTFKVEDYKYSATQISLNYRLKFIKTKRFDFYVNTKIAALSFFEKELPVTKDGVTTFEDKKGSNFNSPLIFGIGADFKVGNGYITFGYHDIVSLNMKGNSEFPIDFSLGYKFYL